MVADTDKSYIVYDFDPEARTATMPSAQSVEAYLTRSSPPFVVRMRVFELPSRTAAVDVIAARYTERGIDFVRVGYAVKRIVDHLLVPSTSVSYKLNRTGENTEGGMGCIVVLCVPGFFSMSL